MVVNEELNNPLPGDLFYTSYDPNDFRLGGLVTQELDLYDEADIVIIGCPQDIGVNRNKGRPGAANGPNQIRSSLYKTTYQKHLQNITILDVGNSQTTGSLEEIHDRHERIVKQMINDNKFVISLGGGNDISYPDCSAVAKNHSNTIAINIDNHFDVRKNEKRNSGTPYRMLLDQNLISPNLFFETACQPHANSYQYLSYLQNKDVQIHWLEDIRQQGVNEIYERILSHDHDSVFWGFDMDSVRASDAPGVSAITPTGLNAYEAVKIAKIAGSHQKSNLFEISEVNPKFDIDNRTTRLAGVMLNSLIHNYFHYL